MGFKFVLLTKVKSSDLTDAWLLPGAWKSGRREASVLSAPGMI